MFYGLWKVDSLMCPILLGISLLDTVSNRIVAKQSGLSLHGC
jgi:hypothetical protein